MAVYYLQTGSTDPAYNLAFEEYVLANRTGGSYLILWQNENAVIIGRNQNAEAEINRSFVQEHGIRVVRRNTGIGDGIKQSRLAHIGESNDTQFHKYFSFAVNQFF